MKDITDEWLKAAKDDLDTIEELINKDHLTNIVAFHAQQCVEKSIKAMMEEYEIPFSKIHSLETLIGKLTNKIDFDIENDIVLKLDKLYLDARYPGDIGLLPDGKPGVEEAKSFLNFAKTFYSNIRKLLKA